MGQGYEFGSITVPRGQFSYTSQLPSLQAAWGRSGSVLKRCLSHRPQCAPQRWLAGGPLRDHYQHISTDTATWKLKKMRPRGPTRWLEGACCQKPLWCEFNPQDSHSGKRAQLPARCQLIASCRTQKANHTYIKSINSCLKLVKIKWSPQRVKIWFMC